MATPVVDNGDPTDLCEEGRFRDAAAAVLEPSLPEPVAARVLGHLALHERASLPTLVRAARASMGEPDSTSLLAMQAARRLARIGADSIASELLAEAMEHWPDDPGLAFIEQQLASGRLEPHDEIEHRAVEAIGAGQLDHGQSILAEATSDTSGHLSTRIRHHQLRAGVLRSQRDHVAAATGFQHLESLAPSADHRPANRLAGALDLWAGGATETALGLLVSARDETQKSSVPQDEVTYRTASELLELLEYDSATALNGPNWVRNAVDYSAAPDESDPGRAVLRLIATRLGLSITLPPSAQHIAQVAHAARAAGATVSRVRLNPSDLASALDERVIIVLEQEPILRPAFVALSDYETVARILLLSDASQLGPELVPLSEQDRRCGVHQWSALAIAGAGPEGQQAMADLAGRGIVADPVLDRLDLCSINPDGSKPTPDDVLVAASAIVRERPDIALSYQLVGEIVVDLLRDSSKQDTAARFEEWVLEARRKFPEATWPARLHGLGLLALDRPDEALALLANCAMNQPLDPANQLAFARAARAVGAIDEARQAADRALTLDETMAEAYTLAAELALDDNDPVAQELTRIAVAVSPEDGPTLALAATVLERNGMDGDATNALTRAANTERPEPSARIRILRHRRARADWPGANDAGAALLAEQPDRVEAWIEAAGTAHARGSATEALDLWFGGIQRCGPSEELVEGAAHTIAALVPPSGNPAPLTTLIAHVRSDAVLLDLIAGVLDDYGHVDEAIALSDRAIDREPRTPTLKFHLAQRLMSHPDHIESKRERILDLLAEVVADSGPYPPPRVLLASMLAANEPNEAVALLREASADAAPSLVYGMGARILDRHERSEDAATMRDAVAELDTASILEHVPWLRTVGLDGLALDLLKIAHDANPDAEEITAQYAYALGAAGRTEEAEQRAGTVNSSELDVMGRIGLAEDAGDWETVATLATEEADRLVSDSRLTGDPWALRGRAAGAHMALGESGPRDELFETAPNQHEALYHLARIEWMAGVEVWQQDHAQLAEVAVGQAVRLSHWASERLQKQGMMT